MNSEAKFWGKNHAILLLFHIRRMKYSRNILPRKVVLGMKLNAIGRNFLSQGKISCHRKKCPVTGRNFLSQEEVSCHRKTFPVTERIFISKDKISSHRKKVSFTRRNFLSQEDSSISSERIFNFLRGRS